MGKITLFQSVEPGSSPGSGNNFYHLKTNKRSLNSETNMGRYVIAFDIGLKNLAYCIMYQDSTSHTICALELVDLGCKKHDTQKIIDSVIEMLDDILYTQLDVSKPLVVLIESQMTSLMKCIQTAINTFFKVTSRYNSMDVTTKYMSAKHKLNLIKRFPEFTSELEPKLSTSQYKQNKMDSIEFALWHLLSKAQDMDVYNKVKAAKKADDLCDSYLMALFFVETEAY